MPQVPYTFGFAFAFVILNPRLSLLQPYPIERLRQWFADVTPNPARMPINLSIGESRHPTPALVAEALAAGVRGLANYPTTIGAPALREAIAAFYLWAKTPIDDADFAKRLFAEQAVKVLPGSFLSRDAHGTNPGRGYIRIALVATRDECAEGMDRILALARAL